MIVIINLGGQRALARVVRRGDQDRLDLCVPMIYPDGSKECLEIFGARRGVEDGQWQELEGEPLPPVSVASAPEEPAVVEVLDAPPVPAPRLPALIVS
jgi:hypothetical protein